MSRFALFILLLQLPFYMNAAAPERADTAAASETDSGSTSSGLADDSDDARSMDAALRDPYASHVDISSTAELSSLLGISEDPSDRGVVASAMRWAGKRTGTLSPGLAGVGPKKERILTQQVLERYAAMLADDQMYNADIAKQFSERQTAATDMAHSFLKALHKANSGSTAHDIPTMQATQQLLDIHKNWTLSPGLSLAIETALRVARDKTAHQMQDPQQSEE